MAFSQATSVDDGWTLDEATPAAGDRPAHHAHRVTHMQPDSGFAEAFMIQYEGLMPVRSFGELDPATNPFLMSISQLIERRKARAAAGEDRVEG